MTLTVYKHFITLLLLITLSGCAQHPNKTSASLPAVIQTTTQLPSPVTAHPKAGSSYLPPAATQTDYSNNYAQRAEVQRFMQHMMVKHGFSEASLRSLFSQAKRLDSIIRLEMGDDHTPGPPKPRLGSWSRYRAIFMTDERIRNGVDFWSNNAAAIEKASRTYGVDAEYIVGIIGVETYFGRNVGKTCVFDALTTLAFDTYRRPKFFKDELENFLLMTREEGYQPRELVGSWAGAMGLGQFMPSSFRRLAVDFDHNGRRDLWQPQDAIGSVAHYFAKNGWQYNNPVAEPAYEGNGGNVIDLSTYEGNEYWQTFHNFKVIKRYNNSKKYAMAVHQLAQAIKERLPLSQSFAPTNHVRSTTR